MEDGYFEAERSPAEARIHWEEITGVKLKSRHMCVAIKTEFDNGYLVRASNLKLGFAYHSSFKWRNRR